MFKKSAVLLGSCLTVSTLYAQQDSSSVQSAKNALQEVVIEGIKAKQSMPITQTTLGSKQIKERYYGADIPTLINTTPSINMQSDNGTGIGYSSFRLRGMDQTRINTTINGIPVNDAENQGVFFNNFADLASSAEQIQIQRGVGTSTNGTSAFGGSINILTKNLTEQPGVEVNLGYGSFQSQRATVEVQSGLLHKRFMFYGRYSHLSTNGYRQHSATQVRSYAFSGVYKMKKALLKFNLFGGFAENQLSYLGIDKTTLQSNRTFNPFVNGEQDAFKQQFYQLQYTHQLSNRQTLTASAYYVRGGAPRFQFLFPGAWGYGFDYFNMPSAIVGTDTIQTAGDMMTSYRLDQRFFGGFVTYSYKSNAIDFTAGAHANQLASSHFMEINWGRIVPSGILQNHEVYRNTGYKSEASAFVKATYALGSKVLLFADLQGRYATFNYHENQMAIRNLGFTVEDMSWMFANWRGGVRYKFDQKHSLYAMLGKSFREPTRFDYFQDDFATRDTKQSDIKPEEVLDLEFGYELDAKKVQAKINGYAMYFTNQIIGLGQLNVFGYPITTNVKNSSRMGVELELNYALHKRISLYNYSAFSSNKIKEITQFYRTTYGTGDSAITYTNVPLGLSPQVMVNQGVKFELTDWIKLDFLYRYVGLQYLDNTGNDAISIPSFNYLDMRLGVKLSKWIKTGLPELSVRANNLLDTRYSTAGSIATGTNLIDAAGNRGSVPLYFVAPGRNYFVSLSWAF